MDQKLKQYQAGSKSIQTECMSLVL